ncbi:phage virion morphogenesis protein [Bosea sp. TWI1241]|uniref:phage virion morphogenesis protein n=1 Tax=Bosea sp. TWI1241 TaxID=3148904 RepID=UPI00320B81DA
MTGQVRIVIDATSDGLAKLEKLIARAERKEALLKNIGDALLKTTSERFDSQKDPQGRAWAPLKPLTVEARGSSAPILTVSGRLRGSLNHEVAGTVLKLGPSAVHGAVHQFGATIKAKNGALRIPLKRGGAAYARQVTIPARPYVGFGPSDEKATTETAQDWFDLEE